MFRAPLCPSSGVQEYYTVVAACGIFCCGFSSSWSGVELRVMHLVGILFPHINDDARSKSHQTNTFIRQCKTTQQTQSSQAARIMSQQIKLKHRTDSLKFGTVYTK